METKRLKFVVGGKVWGRKSPLATKACGGYFWTLRSAWGLSVADEKSEHYMLERSRLVSLFNIAIRLLLLCAALDQTHPS